MGRQQVVWGKTDAFRLQDLVNPIDYSSHNVYPSLEERRIPSLSIDLIHSFGTVGPLQDFSLELVWVVDRFKPLQVGQCGDFWAFTAACEGRADAGAHGLLNQSLARVEERGWSLHNTEPGFRFEFRIPEPSIAFSLSGFWGIQDAPVARFKNHYSTTNPNPAMMLFLQALFAGGPADGIIPGFNPYDAASIQAASDAALRILDRGSRRAAAQIRSATPRAVSSRSAGSGPRARRSSSTRARSRWAGRSTTRFPASTRFCGSRPRTTSTARSTTPTSSTGSTTATCCSPRSASTAASSSRC